MNKTILFRISALLLALLMAWSVLSLGAFADESTQLTQGTEALSSDAGKEQAFALIEKSEIYQAIYNGLQAQQYPISLKGLRCTRDMLKETFQRVLNECPEFFYVNKGVSYSYSTDGSYVAYFYPPYALEGEELELARAEYESMMTELYNMGSESWSDLETVIFYHDYLVAYYEYDTTYQINNAYSFLKEKKGVCAAYTLVFQGLMDHFGIPCTFVSSENINHIWNVVFVDGAWYHVDVTHDDPLYPGSPRYDLEGYVTRTYLLAGSTSSIKNHFENKTNDSVYGASVPVSTKDHPYYSLWKIDTSPIVEVNGSFYGIHKDGSSAKLVRYDLDKGLYTTLSTLSYKWYTVDGRGYYAGNYSTLCTDGRYLYYNEETAIYRYDTEKNIRTQLNDVKCPTNVKIYGLRMEDERLVMYTAAQPYASMTAHVLEKTYPVYYSITWIIDGEEFYSYAAEGELPTFDGSTWIQGENGISYEFIGWTPEVVAATCDATYTACYLMVKDYLPGDIDGDGNVTISDVSALLNYLSDAENTWVNLAAVDTDGNGTVTIADVSMLLNHLSDAGVELN